MKKGITPVVTTILLLLIAVVVIGLAFVFFQTVMKNVTDTASGGINTTAQNMGKLIAIDNVNGSMVVVRNIGTVTIPVAEVSVYINNAPVACSWTGTTILTGRTAPCRFPTGTTCLNGAILKVTSPANDDTVACP